MSELNLEHQFQMVSPGEVDHKVIQKAKNDCKKSKWDYKQFQELKETYEESEIQSKFDMT